MKKLFKFFLGLFLVGMISQLFLFCWVLKDGIHPVLKDANIKVSDIFSNDISPEQFEELRRSAAAKGKQLANELNKTLFSEENAQNIVKLFTVDVSALPAAPYPFEDTTEIVNQVNKNAASAASQGLDLLNSIVDSNNAAKEQGLNLAKEQEAKNTEIKNSVLSEP